MKDKGWNIFFWFWQVILYSIGIGVIPGILWILASFFNEIWFAYGRLLNTIGIWTYLILFVLGLITKLFIDQYKSKQKLKSKIF